MDKTPRRASSSRGLRLFLPGCLLAVAGLASLSSSGQVDRRAASLTPTDDREVKAVIPDADRYTGRVFLERADKLIKPSTAADYQVVTGNVLFRRADMYMYCDSAHFYDATNSIEAFGNVKMEQGDTLFVYANRLVYTDSTAQAVLYADDVERVRLINRDVTLLTDEFTYDLDIELGYYETGGELIDASNRLISIYGEYAPSTKDAVFRDDVVLTSLSRTDTLVIRTDDLRYNTLTHIAELNAPSTVTSSDGTIYTDLGTYNTETTIADLFERSTVVTSTGRTLTGDTIFYDHNLGYGIARGNMVLTDTVNKMRLTGEYGFYNELTDSAFVTGRALAVDYSSPDSLSLHGDTIEAYRVITITQRYIPVDLPVAEDLALDSLMAPLDSIAERVDVAESAVALESADTVSVAETDSIAYIPETAGIPELPELPDSVGAEIAVAEPLAPVDDYRIEETADTARYVVAYRNVRFFRTDLQGVCDSMTYVAKDSLIHLNRDPMVWSDTRQIFGNAIVVHLNDSTADRVTLPNTGFMAEEIEAGFYNQMSGREMVATLEAGELRRLDVSGNVLITFFPMNDEDSTYTKVANAESSFLSADFRDRNIEKLKMWSQSTETITPLYLAKRSKFFLPGFRWEPWRRPLGHDDLFRQPVDPAKQPDDSDSSDLSDPSDSSDQPTENSPENIPDHDNTSDS
ncbi:MAG: hypothetical protein K2I64_07325 [Muribaculaceae bacterium]|nr:hypothetical protein [Muribaculaceae bacterium]